MDPVDDGIDRKGQSNHHRTRRNWFSVETRDGDNSGDLPADGYNSGEDAWRWIEAGLWTSLALSPLLYWINGPAVSHDQLIVRAAVVLVAFVGASALRLRAMADVR